ncbi:hypothetical protein KC207_03400 [Phycicoccus sp. BSK3Z-2]|uniref:Ketopantoate reductase C-terminal domain-containing protein n=1 Tax=Phycicoccus avicenniae TaxID=2828860 RepID=A0A941HZN1_9MICO|nr:ketopantoate reductase C-terminal domain-containing protein [Phycicoccus avicenniae]MBR7742339.1 hypothetical protein [Phycicoccus avicenniae]
MPDIARWKHTKLLMNLGNAVVALCGDAGRGSDLLRRTGEEGRAVLAAAGIAHASEDEDRARRADVLRVRPIAGRDRPGSSTWQSLARGTGTSEVDALNGEVVRIGARAGVPTPVNAALTRLVLAATREGRPPGTHTPHEVLAAAGVD